MTTWLITAAFAVPFTSFANTSLKPFHRATDVFITSSLIYYLRKATGGEHQHLNTKS